MRVVQEQPRQLVAVVGGERLDHLMVLGLGLALLMQHGDGNPRVRLDHRQHAPGRIGNVRHLCKSVELLVKGEVAVGPGCRVEIVHRYDEFAQCGHVCWRGRSHNRWGHVGFEECAQRPELVDLFGGECGDARTAILTKRDEPLGCERMQGLADGDSTDAHRLGDRGLDQGLSWGEHALANALSEHLSNRRTLDRTTVLNAGFHGP